LTSTQRDDLAALLSNYSKLFNGELGLYPHRKLHLDLVENAQPVHRRPYPVPHAEEGRGGERLLLRKRTLVEVILLS
jgi:hypothetical protein